MSGTPESTPARRRPLIVEKFTRPEINPVECLAEYLTSPDRADRFMAGIFADCVDMSTATVLQSTDGTELILNAEVEKDCDPKISLALRRRERQNKANLTLVIDHKEIVPGRPGHAGHLEFEVSGNEGENNGIPNKRYAYVVPNGSEWHVSHWGGYAFQLVGKLMLAADIEFNPPAKLKEETKGPFETQSPTS